MKTKKLYYLFLFLLVSKAAFPTNPPFCGYTVVDENIGLDKVRFDSTGTFFVPYYYDTYIDNGGGNSGDLRKIINPFVDSDNPNIKDLYKNGLALGKLPDNQVAEGWRLVSYRFGRTTRSLSGQSPMLILYNKYSGILRVFAHINKSTFDGILVHNGGISITLRQADYPSSNFARTAFLANADEVMNSVEEFNPTAKIIVTNKYLRARTGVATDAMWMRADFPIMYDPCTCKNPNSEKHPFFMVEIQAIEKATVKLNTTFSDAVPEDYLTGDDNAGDMTFSTLFDAAFTIMGEVNINYRSGSSSTGGTSAREEASSPKKYKGRKGGYGQRDGGAYFSRSKRKQYRSFNNGNWNLQYDKNDNPSGRSKSKPMRERATGETVADMGRVFIGTVAPEVNIALNIVGTLDAFVSMASGNEKSAGYISESRSFLDGVTANTEGTIETKGDVDAYDVYLPGSNHPVSDDYQKPYYDNVLGVFSVLRTPQLEAVEFAPNNENYELYCECNPTLDDPFRCFNKFGKATAKVHYKNKLPKAREYRLKRDTQIEYAINPASDLELIDIKASMQFDYSKVGKDYLVAEANKKPEIDNNGFLYWGTIAYTGPFAVALFFWDSIVNLWNGDDINIDYTNLHLFNGPVFKNKAPLNDIKLADYEKEIFEQQKIYVELGNGNNMLKDFVYGTDYVPLEALKDYPVKVFADKDGNYPEVYIKFMVILRRKDNPEASDLVQIFKYKTTTATVHTGYKYYITTPNRSDDPKNNDMVKTYITGFDEVPNWPSNPLLSFSTDANNISAKYYTSLVKFGEASTEASTISPSPTIKILAFDEKYTFGGVLSLQNAHKSFGKKVTYVSSEDIEVVGEATIDGEITIASDATEVYPVSYFKYVAPKTDETYFTTLCTGRGSNQYNETDKAFPTARLEASINLNSKLLEHQKPTPTLTAIPNPTTGRVAFHYKLVEDAEVVLTLTDITGHIIATLAKGSRPLGMQQEVVNLDFLPNGVYLYTLETSAGYRETQRLVVAK